MPGWLPQNMTYQAPCAGGITHLTVPLVVLGIWGRIRGDPGRRRSPPDDPGPESLDLLVCNYVSQHPPYKQELFFGVTPMPQPLACLDGHVRPPNILTPVAVIL